VEGDGSVARACGMGELIVDRPDHYVVGAGRSQFGIVTEIRAGQSGVRCPAGTTFLSFPDRSDLLWGPAPFSHTLNGYRSCFLGSKATGA